MPRRSSLVWLAAVPLSWAAGGCDKSGPLAGLDAAGPAAATASAADSLPTDAAPVEAGHNMPPRPVPTSSPTVLVTMPIETQLKTIQYMAAMQAPQPGDPPANPDYAKTIADQLRAVGKTEVISSGRLVDIKLEKGCDANLPKQAIARNTGAALGTLLANGMLVVRCTDKQIQCLQSTRDATDVICVHK
jgi:hypothetical protein